MMMAYCQAVTKKGKFEGFLSAEQEDIFKATAAIKQKAIEHSVWPYGMVFKFRSATQTYRFRNDEKVVN